MAAPKGLYEYHTANLEYWQLEKKQKVKVKLREKARSQANLSSGVHLKDLLALVLLLLEGQELALALDSLLLQKDHDPPTRR